MKAADRVGHTVLVIDDHRLFADVITSTLRELGMKVLGPVGTGTDGLAMARQERPGLVLVDIGLPDESGLTVGKTILNEQPGAKVVAVTSLAEPKLVQTAIRLGFHGYITKDTPVRQFLSSIRAVLDGQVVISRQLARRVVGVRSPEEQQAAMLIAELTKRERQVLDLLSEGASSSRIAKKLAISPNTVRSHVQNILSKLQVHSRLEAAAFAVRHGGTRAGEYRT